MSATVVSDAAQAGGAAEHRVDRKEQEGEEDEVGREGGGVRRWCGGSLHR